MARIAALLVLLVLVAGGCGSSLAEVDGERFRPPAKNAITFWGHSCCYIDIDGFGIVTDPVFEKHLIFRTRKVAAPPPAAYAAANLILISHAHDDHLSAATVQTFPSGVTVLCPEPSRSYLEDIPQSIRVMHPGDEHPIPGGRIIAVVAHHTGGRLGWRSKSDGRALGYVIETAAATIYWTGDTGFFDGFVEVGSTYRPDITIFNVSGHLTGTPAARAMAQTGADVIVPVHYGAYGFLFVDEKKRARTYDELKRRLGPRLVPIALGESLPLAVARTSRSTP